MVALMALVKINKVLSEPRQTTWEFCIVIHLKQAYTAGKIKITK
jgi:hypothetical protein